MQMEAQKSTLVWRNLCLGGLQSLLRGPGSNESELAQGPALGSMAKQGWDQAGRACGMRAIRVCLLGGGGLWV